MKLRTGLVLVLLAALAAHRTHAQAQQPSFSPTNKVVASARVFAHLEAFEWTETLQGREFVKETGPLYGLGGEMELRLGRRLLLGLSGDFFAGEVDYDGAIQQLDGTFTPAESTTTYVGMNGAVRIAAPYVIAERVTLKPAAGLGLRAWERTLDTGFDSRYIGDYGYIEDWFAAHALFGATLEFTVSPVTTLFLAGEVRLPLWTAENIDLSNVGGPDDVELEPKAQPTVFVEAGVRHKKLFASAFVESLDFDESDYDSNYGQYLQPKSEATIAGGRVGLWF